MIKRFQKQPVRKEDMLYTDEDKDDSALLVENVAKGEDKGATIFLSDQKWGEGDLPT